MKQKKMGRNRGEITDIPNEIESTRNSLLPSIYVRVEVVSILCSR